ncbi:MAG: hypothetical protein AAB392_00995 [Patescibacteria group bacterium]
MNKAIWILRIGVAGEFLGHGIFALQGKEGWFKYFTGFGITDPATITSILFAVGLMDVLFALIVLFKPLKPILLWMAFWGLWTALVRWPFGPDPVWDFVERFANWAAPLSLYYILKSRGE